MAIRVKLPNGQYGNFPDEMSHEEIESVLQKQFPKESNESFGEKLPRNIASGFAGLGHSILNAPYNTVKGIEEFGQNFGSQLNIPGPEVKTSPYEVSENIPHQEEHNFPQMLGQKGEGTLSDKLIQGFITHAPELVAAGKGAMSLGKIAKSSAQKFMPVRSKGIAELLKSNKNQAIEIAKKDYSQLFKEAAEKGINSVPVPKINKDLIVKHSAPKYHESLLEYAKDPSLENAHWAQSELKGLQRHLTKIDETIGLTPTQHRTLKEVNSAADKIKKAMFAEHKLGKDTQLAEKYNQLSQEYQKNVIPYKNLKRLSQYEKGELEASDLIKLLSKDKKFKALMGKQYPQIGLNQLLNKSIVKYPGYGLLLGAGEELTRHLLK